MSEQTFEKIIVGLLISFAWVASFCIVAVSICFVLDFINNFGGF